MTTENQNTQPPQNSDSVPKKAIPEPIKQALIVFSMILVLFLAIEIIPLHFGKLQIPFELLWPEVKKRLPRILLVAVAASILVSLPKKEKKA